VAVQFGDVLRDTLTALVEPWAVTDPIARIDGSLTLRTQVGVPGSGATPRACGQRLAVRVSSTQSSEIRAGAFACARHEKRHRLRRRRGLLCNEDGCGRRRHGEQSCQSYVDCVRFHLSFSPSIMITTFLCAPQYTLETVRGELICHAIA